MTSELEHDIDNMKIYLHAIYRQTFCDQYFQKFTSGSSYKILKESPQYWTHSRNVQKSYFWKYFLVFILINFVYFKLAEPRVSVCRHSSSLLMPLQLSTPDDQCGWEVGVLLIAHVTSTLNSWWPMGVGWGWWGPPPHCSCHFNSKLLMTNGGGVGLVGSSSSLFMSLQVSTPDDQWGWVVSSSSLLMSPTKLIAAQQWNETDFHCCIPAQIKLVLA